MIEIVVSNAYCTIYGLNDPVAVKKIDRALSYFVSGYQFAGAYKSGNWDGRKRLLLRKKNCYWFMVGLLSRVESLLKGHGLDYTLYDQRPEVILGKPLKTDNIEQRVYQANAVQAAIKEKSGIIKIPTGGGKTAVIAEMIAAFNVPTLVYVPGIDLLYQTKESLEYFLPGTRIGIIGDGVADIQRITVCTIWSCVKALGKDYEKFDEEDTTRAETFDESNKEKIKRAINSNILMIVDECQFLGTTTLQHINAESKKARLRFGMSATAYREDGADLLLEGAVGKTIVEVTASELIHDGFLVPPIIHFVEVPESDSTKSYQTIYKDYIVENEERNEKIVNAAKKLEDAGRKVLILIKNIRHGEILLEELEKNSVVYFVRGELDSDERNRIKDSFKRGEFNILIASTIFDQGVDIPILDSMILACGGKSVGKLFQRVGRVIRPNKETSKKDAIVVDFIDRAKYLIDHSKKRLETYRTEAGFKVKLPKKDPTNAKIKKKKAKRLPPTEGW